MTANTTAIKNPRPFAWYVVDSEDTPYRGSGFVFDEPPAGNFAKSIPVFAESPAGSAEEIERLREEIADRNGIITRLKHELHSYREREKTMGWKQS